ncbi:hypothetical protein [Streptomyces sp. NBC_01190]|uniref:hypothetical protein n=1 Tax=Streptomyces sp. NBC_01190 TaxID=2903767 RepID=UPI003867C84E|nr:hypothetical protein OG519_05970 [Streptomyces sp. NBC_01190]
MRKRTLSRRLLRLAGTAAITLSAAVAGLALLAGPAAADSDGFGGGAGGSSGGGGASGTW